MKQIRVSKSSSYFCRFRVKYRRRREGKTDYRARRGLINQDKNKYAAPKLRLIVRFSNSNITCQVAYTTMVGDKIFCSAYAHELHNYGLSLGLTNYSASYCVGLLCARRCLSKFALDNTYNRKQTVNEDNSSIQPDEGSNRHSENTVRVILDSGLKSTSSGSKVFAVLKGALDGGLKIPHNEKRFVGYDKITKKFTAETMQKYIFCSHVSEFMGELKEEEPDSFLRQFSRYIKHKVEHDDLEEIYKKVHKAIWANPARKEKTINQPTHASDASYFARYSSEKKRSFSQKLHTLGIHLH